MMTMGPASVQINRPREPRLATPALALDLQNSFPRTMCHFRALSCRNGSTARIARHRGALLPCCASPSSSSKPKAPRVTVADLRGRIAELEAENEALRAALFAGQGGPPSSGLHPLQSTLFEPAEDDAGRDIAAALPANELIAQLQSGIAWPSPGESPRFFERPARSSPLPLTPASGSDGAAPPPPTPQRPMHVVHVTAEMAPYAKVGGLGDVVTGLTKACLAQGHRVEIVLPFYECLKPEVVEDLVLEREFECPKARYQDGEMHWGPLRTQAWTGRIEGCPVILLRPNWDATGSPLFRGNRIYGGSYNEAEAYLYFCRAALEYLVHSGRRPDIIHAHEWQASAVPMLYWECFAGLLPGARPALTIHNLDNTGECRQDEFAATGVDGTLFADIDKALDERTIGHNPERLCLLKGGIVYSSIVTTVSPTYAQEAIGGGAAGWLRSTLARPEVSNKYWGVLNGIDVEAWDPACDALLPACYSAAVPQGKALCKRFLQRGLGMNEDPSKPLVAVISRLVPQKGIHLIEHAVGRTVDRGGQFVLLGTGHADGGLRRMVGETFRDSRDVKMEFAYSEALAHLIYAAADIFLVPSMFEPCGLTQMIALRYGGVPVVRATGGLADTVRDVETDGETVAPGAPPPNGFVFPGTDAGSLNSALDRAIDMYKQQPQAWAALRDRNISDSERWSWVTPAQSYLGLYSGVLSSTT